MIEDKYIVNDPETGKQIALDQENLDFFRAFELVRTTTTNLFLTGKAGTGKTTFLKFVKSYVPKQTSIVAFTGLAAVNAGGQTIHSFFQIAPKAPPFTPWDKRLRKKAPVDDTDRTTIYQHFKYSEYKRELLQSLDLLIIDEVSMVRADMLDVIDKILRAFSGKNRTAPFGGVQIVLIGDTFQLPPIEGDEWKILTEFYKSPFFFDADVIKKAFPLQMELRTIYRQNEIEFINLLNRIRVNEPSASDLTILNNKVRPLTDKDFENNYIVLCSTNPQANQINLNRLGSLLEHEKIFQGVITGIFNQSTRPTEEFLKLKVGAQVMFLKSGINYYNGKIGTIDSIEGNEIIIKVKNSDGELTRVKAERYKWENVEYTLNRETKKIETRVIGTFIQFPLKLAWAITVHKSQGLTFEKVFININNFAPSGLTYVALSRCSSYNGLALLRPLTRDVINTDRRVIEYAKEVAPEMLVTEILSQGKADILYIKSYNAIKNSNYTEAYDIFLTALKYRNDLETKEFKRVVYHLLKQRDHSKHLLKVLNEQNVTLNHLNGEQTITMSLAYDNYIASQSEIREVTLLYIEESEEKFRQKRLLNVQNYTIKELSDDKEKLSNEVEILRKHCTSLETERDSFKKKSDTNKKEILTFIREGKKLKSRIINLEENSAREQDEILRLSNLSWFEKLLGKK